MSDAPSTSPKLLADGWKKLRIAAASAFVLVVGAAVAPPRSPSSLATSQERPAPLLEEQVQQREQARVFRGVQDVVDRVIAHTVPIPRPVVVGPALHNDFDRVPRHARHGGSGVFVAPNAVLTHFAVLGGQQAVDLDVAGTRTKATVAAFEPETGLVLLRTESAGSPASIDNAAAAPGSLSVAVGHAGTAPVAIPVFLTHVAANEYVFGGDDEAIVPGMPIFSLDGGLVAIVGNGAGERIAYPAGSAATRLLARAAVDDRRSSIGVGLQVISDDLRRVWKEGSLVVSRVIAGGPAERAGLQPGDVIRRIGDADVLSMDVATAALDDATVGVPVALHVTRGARELRLDVTPATAYEVAWLARVAVVPQDEFPAARDLFAGDLLTRAAIPPTARVVALNGRPVTTRTQADQALRRATAAIPVLLRAGDEQYFVAIERQP